MSACRQTASLWFWLRHDFKLFIKQKMWRNDYFWHDSFGKYWNRSIGCRLNGHKNVHRLEEGCINPNPHWYCFACETEVDPSEVDNGT